MQNKKYFFGLAVSMVAFLGVFGLRSEAGAANVGCYDAIAGSCNELDKSGGATCSSPATWCASDARCNGTVCASTTIPTSGTQTPTEFTNPLGFSSIDGVLTSLLGSLKGFVVILAIIFIVIGGIMYMLSAGDPKMVEQAKKSWLYAVIGLAIVVAAPTFLKQVQEILGGTLTGGGIETARSVKDIANGILKFLLSITGIIAIISLVIAGGMYMTAYGEEKQITTAKSIGKWAIVGIVVALGSLTIIQQVSKLITG
ncbi:MAG: TrbC/VirB2 family protein [Candidatus Moraniibacteriota bacterium]